MSTGGHWFAPETAEQYLAAVEGLESSASAAYTQIVTKDLAQIEARLSGLAESDEELARETQRRLQEVVGLIGRFRSQTASALLALEQETKQIREAMARGIKEQSELEAQRLDIEKSKLQLERWKVVLGAVALFLTGFLFPLILWQLGVGVGP